MAGLPRKLSDGDMRRALRVLLDLADLPDQLPLWVRGVHEDLRAADADGLAEFDPALGIVVAETVLIRDDAAGRVWNAMYNDGGSADLDEDEDWKFDQASNARDCADALDVGPLSDMAEELTRIAVRLSLPCDFGLSLERDATSSDGFRLVVRCEIPVDAVETLRRQGLRGAP